MNEQELVFEPERQRKKNDEKQLSDNIQLKDIINTKQQFALIWKDIYYSITSQEKTRVILNNITGYCKSGELTAIMGSSGAGKFLHNNNLFKKESLRY